MPSTPFKLRTMRDHRFSIITIITKPNDILPLPYGFLNYPKAYKRRPREKIQWISCPLGYLCIVPQLDSRPRIRNIYSGQASQIHSEKPKILLIAWRSSILYLKIIWNRSRHLMQVFNNGHHFYTIPKLLCLLHIVTANFLLF